MSDTEQETPPVEPDAPPAPVEPEPEPEDQPEPEEPVEPQEPPQEPEPEQESQARMEEIGKQLDKLQKHVSKRLGDILGDDAPFYIECELCTPFQTPGMRPPIELPPDVQASLWHLLGQHSPTEYRSDQHSRACPECDGFGEVVTGSKVLGQDKLTCVHCTGLGWEATDEQRRPRFGTAANGLTPSSPPPSPGSSAPPAPLPEDPPEVAALKAQGYAVIAPYVVPA